MSVSHPDWPVFHLGWIGLDAAAAAPRQRSVLLPRGCVQWSPPTRPSSVVARTGIDVRPITSRPRNAFEKRLEAAADDAMDRVAVDRDLRDPGCPLDLASGRGCDEGDLDSPCGSVVEHARRMESGDRAVHLDRIAYPMRSPDRSGATVRRNGPTETSHRQPARGDDELRGPPPGAGRAPSVRSRRPASSALSARAAWARRAWLSEPRRTSDVASRTEPGGSTSPRSAMPSSCRAQSSQRWTCGTRPPPSRCRSSRPTCGTASCCSSSTTASTCSTRLPPWWRTSSVPRPTSA